MMPRIIIHNAVSLDGRIDGFTPDIGLYYELASGWNEDATLAGSNTIIGAEEESLKEDDGKIKPQQDDPTDTRPLLVVVDSRGRVRNWQLLRKAPYWKDFIALCSQSTPKEYLNYLEKRTIRTIVSGDDRVDLKTALEELNRDYGVNTVRVESGGTLNGVLLREGLVDEVSILVHPYLVGGMTPRSIYRTSGLAESEQSIPLRLVYLEKLKKDLVWMRYEVVKK
jgi:2,5-diamino-6-(ribosylamino)-4(3H)-pyrimidinone 5'-phosphate reductase